MHFQNVKSFLYWEGFTHTLALNLKLMLQNTKCNVCGGDEYLNCAFRISMITALGHELSCYMPEHKQHIQRKEVYFCAGIPLTIFLKMKQFLRVLQITRRCFKSYVSKRCPS